MSRRLLATAIAIITGTVGAISLAAPVQAAVPDNVTVDFNKSNCLINGVRQVVWDLTNPKPFAIKLTAIDATPAGSGVSTPVNTIVPASSLLQIVQQVPPAASSALINVHWVNNEAADPSGNTFKEILFETPCVAQVRATFDPNCDGTTNVTLINDTRQTQHFIVNAPPAVDVPAGTSQVVPNVPQSPVGEVDVTVVAGEDVDSDLLHVGTYKWVSPRDCPTPTPSPSNLVNTGTSVTGVVGLGAGLVLGGVVLLLALVLLRRRRAASGS